MISAEGESYPPDALSEKKAFVESVLREFRPRKVLDIGCNTGLYSDMSAGKGAWVVGIDSDPVAAGTAWRRADENGSDVLSLHVDLTRPTPAVG